MLYMGIGYRKLRKQTNGATDMTATTFDHTTELIDLDAILANYNAIAPELLTQEEIDMFNINFLLESTDTETEVDESLLNFEF